MVLCTCIVQAFLHVHEKASLISLAICVFSRLWGIGIKGTKIKAVREEALWMVCKLLITSMELFTIQKQFPHSIAYSVLISMGKGPRQGLSGTC